MSVSTNEKTNHNYATNNSKKIRTAVVGCGAISDIYLTNMMHRFPNLEVTACTARHLESAQKKAAQYGIRACSYEEILQDETIDMVNIADRTAAYHSGPDLFADVYKRQVTM